MTVLPRRIARWRSSPTSRDLPMPASPPMTTTPPSPRRAARSASSSSDISESRPTRAGETTRATAKGSAPRLLGFLRLAQPPAERLQQPVRDLRVLGQERLKAPLGHRGDHEVALGADVGAAALVVEQRHLPEVIARAKRAMPAVGR